MEDSSPAGSHWSLWSPLLRRIDRRSAIGFLLLAALVGIASTGINALTDRRDDFSLPLMTLLGLAVCWWLAGRRVSHFGFIGLSIPAGIVLAILLIGQLAPQAGMLLRSASSLAWEVLSRSPEDPLPEPTMVIRLAVDFITRVQQLLNTGWEWGAGLLRGRTANNPRAANLVWSILMWCTAAWSAWWVRRRANPLAAALPTLILYALSAAFARSSAGGIAAALAALLALTAWSEFTKRQSAWEHSAMDVAEDLSFDLGMWAIILCLGIAGLALTAAGPSPQLAFRSARSRLLERRPAVSQLGEALGLQSGSQPGGAPAAGISGILPRQHLLTGGVELNHYVAMLVQLPPLPPSTALPNLRAVAYDVYTGQGWITSNTERIDYPAGQNLPYPHTPGQMVEFSVQMVDTSKVQIYAPGELIRVDQPLRVDWRSRDAVPDAFGARLQLSGQNSDRTGQPIEPLRYQAVIWVSPVGENELRQSGRDYPEEIKRRYLQLPDTLPPRVRSLAVALTEHETTPYDRARAIEAYLRAYRYSLDLPAPPSRRDLVDYFLFDLRAGYCDYNASAMVMLARAAGIPARLAIGYALPPASYTTPDGDTSYLRNANIVITEDLAHSWPELYFPGWGWIAFEPTGGRNRTLFPDEPSEIAITTAVPLNALSNPTDYGTPAIWPTLISASIFLLLLLSLVWFVFNAERVHGPAELTKMYLIVRRESRRLGVRLYPGQTPFELSTALSAALVNTFGPRQLESWALPAAEQAQRLIDLYTSSQYSSASFAPEELLAVRRGWLQLRLRLWRARMQIIFKYNRNIHSE